MPQQTLTGEQHSQVSQTPMPGVNKLVCFNPEFSISAMWANSLVQVATSLAGLISAAVNSVVRPDSIAAESKDAHRWYVPR